MRAPGVKTIAGVAPVAVGMLGALVGFFVFSPTVARAETAMAPAQIAAVIEGKSLEQSKLVGTSGQIFEPAESGGWKRSGRGGVACRVSAAYTIGNDLWAVCSWAPLFKRTAGVWSAEPLTNRGAARPSPIAASPLVSVGRHLYGVRKGGWERLSSAPSSITSLLAASSRSAVAVSSRGELLRLSGSSWKVLIARPKRSKPTDDPPRAVFGSARNAYVVLQSGELLHIGASRRKAVALPTNVGAFSVGASCAEPGGDVLAIGRATSSAGTITVAMMRLSGAAATDAGAAPTLADDERIGILHCKDKRALLSTSRGRVLIREADGTWSEKTLVARPPAETTKTTPGSRPAKTR